MNKLSLYKCYNKNDPNMFCIVIAETEERACAVANDLLYWHVTKAKEIVTITGEWGCVLGLELTEELPEEKLP